MSLQEAQGKYGDNDESKVNRPPLSPLIGRVAGMIKLLL
jgi:hypothetical protein